MSNLSSIFFVIASLLIFPQRLPAQKPTILPEAQNLHGLSYVQVRQELLSKHIHEQRFQEIAKENFQTVWPKPSSVNPSSDSSTTLRERIIHADVTNEERETLWWLYLYTNLASYACQTHPQTRAILHKRRVTPRSRTEFGKKLLKNMYTAGKVTLISSASLSILVGILSKLSHPYYLDNREHFAAAGITGAIAFMGIGCISAYCALLHTLVSPLGASPTEYKDMLRNYEAHVKATQEHLPNLAQKLTDALQEKLSECPWELTYGVETAINHSALERYSSIIRSLHSTLERLARIEPGEEIA